MALLTVQQVVAAGTVPTYAAATGGGDTVKVDDRTFLHVKNTNGATRDVTLVSAVPCSAGGTTVHNRVVTVAATTGDVMIYAGPGSQFNDPTTQVASITYSAATGVTIAAVRV